MTIDLPVWMVTEKAWRVVEAEIVDVAPRIPSATWAVHALPWAPRCFRVSNIETGCYVTSDADARAEAIKRAEKYLSAHTDLSYRLAVRHTPKACRT